MASTITEKILARAAGRPRSSPATSSRRSVDLALATTSPRRSRSASLRTPGFDQSLGPAAIALVPDHFAPNKDVKAAGQARRCASSRVSTSIVNYFEVGRMGIEHVLLPELGLVAPGDVVIGADRHTCTYGAVAAFQQRRRQHRLRRRHGVGPRVAARARDDQVRLHRASPQPCVTGKDLMLHTIGDIGVDGALYQAMEFHRRRASKQLSMDERFTMCNMAIEAGRTGWQTGPVFGQTVRRRSRQAKK